MLKVMTLCSSVGTIKKTMEPRMWRQISAFLSVVTFAAQDALQLNPRFYSGFYEHFHMSEFVFQFLERQTPIFFDQGM